jgi:hypothetical protein
MPKGHSTLEPRINTAEAKLEVILLRLTILERQIAAMNDAFSNGNLPRPQYESQFKVWPSANPATNGT